MTGWGRAGCCSARACAAAEMWRASRGAPLTAARPARARRAAPPRPQLRSPVRAEAPRPRLPAVGTCKQGSGGASPAERRCPVCSGSSLRHGPGGAGRRARGGRGARLDVLCGRLAAEQLADQAHKALVVLARCAGRGGPGAQQILSQLRRSHRLPLARARPLCLSGLGRQAWMMRRRGRCIGQERPLLLQGRQAAGGQAATFAAAVAWRVCSRACERWMKSAATSSVCASAPKARSMVVSRGT